MTEGGEDDLQPVYEITPERLHAWSQARMDQNDVYMALLLNQAAVRIEELEAAILDLLQNAANKHTGPRMHEPGECKACEAVRTAQSLLREETTN